MYEVLAETLLWRMPFKRCTVTHWLLWAVCTPEALCLVAATLRLDQNAAAWPHAGVMRTETTYLFTAIPGARVATSVNTSHVNTPQKENRAPRVRRGGDSQATCKHFN